MRLPAALPIHVLAAALCLPLGAGAPPEASPAKSASTASPDAAARHAKILKLLRLMDTGGQAQEGMKQALGPVKTKLLEQEKQGGLPEGFVERFFEVLMKECTAQVLEEELFAPVYEKQLSDAEVEALLVFYATPEGRSFARKQAALYQEASKTGEAFGQRKAMEIMGRLLQEMATKPAAKEN